MSEHLMTACLSKSAKFCMKLKFNCFDWVSSLIVRYRVIKFDCSYWVFRINHILMISSILTICTLSLCSMLKIITLQTLSFLSFQLRIVLMYFFLTAVLNSEFEIIDFFSFLEMIYQRSLTFRVLIISIFHDL